MQKITPQKAIEILKRQQAKISSVTENNYSAWENQFESNISDYFGIQSTEYKYAKEFSFYSMGTISTDMSYHIKITSPQVFAFLENCIETINDKGLYEPPKVNFLYRIKAENLIAIILVSIPGLFGLGTLYGKYLSDAQNIELKIQVKNLQEKLKLPSPISKDTNNVPDDKGDTTGHRR